MMWPHNLSKYVSLTEEVDWETSSSIFSDTVKNWFPSINYIISVGSDFNLSYLEIELVGGPYLE